MNIHIEDLTTSAIQKVTLAAPPGLKFSQASIAATFDKVKKYLSSNPLRRPNRAHPLVGPSNLELLKLAKTHQPPAEWHEGEEERPF